MASSNFYKAIEEDQSILLKIKEQVYLWDTTIVFLRQLHLNFEQLYLRNSSTKMSPNLVTLKLVSSISYTRELKLKFV